MIGQKRHVSEFKKHDLEDGLHKEKPAYSSDPYHLGLSTEAFTEYLNFKTYLGVSIQNSKYATEEMPFVDRDCDRILRIAGMLHCWQHIEKVDEIEGGFNPSWSSAREIADISISLKTLQRAIVIVLFTMQTRRANFPRFSGEKKDDEKSLGIAEEIIPFIANEERFKEYLPFNDIKTILAKEFPDLIIPMTKKALGSFFKDTLGVESESKRIKNDKGKSVPAVCYRLSDAVENWQSRCPEPESTEDDTPIRVELESEVRGYE